GVLALGWLAGATGGFHLDGVADTADGLGSRAAPEKALMIMKKSDIGPMGVMSIVLVLLVDAAAVVSLAGTAGSGAWWRVAILVGLGPALARAAI
ncbi:adenosylcobinamide-GDP ribazoletransferase, partial [Nocardia cyriacigeorgica]|nr:adenosylcobinamide-GDP ribazoletransferase [Nocardia cyriacigeorgica]